MEPSPAPCVVDVNGQRLEARPGETVLQVALRHGLPFPRGCRVGGCGACRCTLVDGAVRPLTEADPLLTSGDLGDGTILACQSVPTTDVRVQVARVPKRPRPARVDLSLAPRRVAGVFDYLKYTSFHVLGLVSLLVLTLGGGAITAGLFGVVTLYVLGDAVAGDDVDTPTWKHPGVLTFQLWLALPLLAAIVFVAVWGACDADPLGFGAWASSWSGLDLLAARAATSTGQRVSAWGLTGLMIGMVGTIPAHELTHRPWDVVSMVVGRCLLAFSFDTSFSIEHVHGHHRSVSTLEDPATAPRGRSVYAHIVASTWKGNRSAWRLEAARLAEGQRGPWSVHNRFLRGQVLSVALLAAAWGMGGVRAVLFFSACALWGKALLEIVNYLEHYGLVRDPLTPVAPRHSWNTTRRVSSWTLFNLTRHSHHHAQAEVPYQDLRPFPDAPQLLSGYLSTILVALVPPLWHRLVTPRVLDWDRRFATPTERALAAEANRRSGLAALERASATPP